MRKFSEKKWASNAIVMILLFVTGSFSAIAQNNSVNVSNPVKIIKVDVTNESAGGLIDGKIRVTITDNNSRTSRYRLSYDFLAEGNNFVSEELTGVNNILTLNNAKIGPYYNLRVIRTADNLKSAVADAFSLKNSEIRNVAGFQETPPTNLTCSGTLSYVNCAGANKSISSPISGSAYCDENSYRPCGFEVTSNCTITGIHRWHCFDGNLSVPPNNNRYNITDYAGAGLTALQACRINWVVCNYAYDASGVANAIWYIAGTGGSNNSIAQAAAAAVPIANGTQNNMVFYNSVNSNYQSMVKWTCATASCTGRVTSLYFNELNGGADLSITNGSTFTVTQLGSLYDLEVGTTGAVGSIKYTITGPTPSSNVENITPYNSPGTGTGPWIGATGTYSVNLKTYSGPDATGTLCHDTTITFNLIQTLGSIGNRVWFDTNGNGIQDASETIGLSGITVKLRNSSNAVIATTTTDANGNYLFSNIAAGTYTVEFPKSTASYILSPAYVGTNRDIDSDPSTSTGLTPAITLSTGQNIINIDAGYTADCSCTNSTANLLTNGSFENGTTGWTLSGGNLTTGTGYVMCGTNNGFVNWTSGTVKMYQDINVVAGATVHFSGYSGTHTQGISCSPKLSLIFLNSSNAVISQIDVTVTKNVDLTGANLDLYTITGVAPAGTVKVRAQASIGCNTLKVDAFCLTVIPPPAHTNPDFNSTFVNIPVPGNVSTNDNVPAGTTYGTSPTLLSSPAGSSPSIAMNSNGTYSFVSNLPGVYTYDVPVCVPGQSAPCPPTKLVITVLDATVNTNPPVANVDIATTKINTAVTLKTLANDAAGNLNSSLVPSTVIVTIAPLHGTTSTNAATGDITFTPTTGYTGTDTLTYQVCDNQSPAKCATAKQIITILPSTAANTTTAADDYKIVSINMNGTGNVKTNDVDPEGNTQTVTAQNTTIAGKGTLILATDGNYTFVPVTGFTGPVDYPYTTCDNGTPQACASATLHILVRPEVPSTNPDFNSTYVNVPVPGNVSTNDKVPAGTTYGTSPTLLSSPAGSSPVLTMNSNGTYSFVSNVPGVYTYDVPVCVPNQIVPCPPTKLVITVLNANVNTNPPVANVDIATTNVNIPVTLKTLVNDAAANTTSSLVASTVTVTVAPLHGTTSVNPATGDITYTPASGYTGTDTLTYQVCDNQSPSKCATAKQIITIKPPTAANTTAAADDYKITDINTPASGNVKTNDTDPENNTQTVAAQTTTVAGKGTLVLATDGNYTFTPVTGYTGPVDFPYTTCDNGIPQACAMATLHILIRPVVPATNPDFNSTLVNVPVPGNVSTNDKVPAGTTYGTSPALLSSPAGSSPSITMNSDGTYSFVSNVKGVYVYDVPVCVPGQTAPCPPTKLTITVLDGTINSNAPVANVDIAATKVNVPVTLKTLSNDAAGNTANSLVPSSVTVTVAPLHGTTSVNAATGDITYTPASGYTGTDTLTYQVCDDQSPSKCATANQIITIKPATAPNTTEAADDYKITAINTSANGNVKTNDTDAEGNTQTVTAQNTTIAGKGTLVLGTDGNYTFTPVAGFTGPVDYPYTTCDNGVPQACATATLHILVKPLPQLPDLTPSIFNDGTTLVQNTTRDNVIRIFNIGTGATSGTIIFTIPKMLPAYQITIDPNETFMDVFGGLPVANSDWTIVEEATRYVFTSKPGVVIAGGGGSKDVGVKVKAIGIKSSTANLSVRIVFGTGGGETPFNNNADNNTYSTN